MSYYLLERPILHAVRSVARRDNAGYAMQAGAEAAQRIDLAREPVGLGDPQQHSTKQGFARRAR